MPLFRVVRRFEDLHTPLVQYREEAGEDHRRGVVSHPMALMNQYCAVMSK